MRLGPLARYWGESFEFSSPAGGGLAMTPVTALIQLLYKGPERARLFGILGAVFRGSSAAGPLLGGLLIQSGEDIGWRLDFLVNVPFGILAAILGAFVLPASQPRGSRGSDPAGLLLFIAAVIATMLPFSLGISTSSIVLLVLGLALFALFTVIEQRRSAPRGSPSSPGASSSSAPYRSAS